MITVKEDAMLPSIPRRRFLRFAPSLLALPALGFRAGSPPRQDEAGQETLPANFPAHDPVRVREIVGASHGNLQRVSELLGESPALAKASWDWGYGDWETALGAASHTGSLDIATLLIAHGARPDIFTFAMMGQLAVVKACVAANPGVQRTHGPHGITLLQHARKGGEPAAAVAAFLEEIGDADIAQVSAPLSEGESRIYLGDYLGEGSGTGVRLRISVSKEGRINLMRVPDGANRMLFHLGSHAFHPTGAPAVRIQFAVDAGRATSLTVVDGQPLFIGARVA